MADTMSRREAMSGMGASAAACQLPAKGKHSGCSHGLIDVHHHIRPPGAPEGFARLTAKWSPEGAIAEMDAAGIAAGMAYPGPILPSVADKADRARRFNEYGATLGQAHSGRFGLFASLPLPDIAATLAEIDFALTALKADGFGVSTSYGEAWLGDPMFTPVHEKLNAHDAVVFVHPHDAACCAPGGMTYIQPGMDGSWIDWPMNTARTIFSLMTSGTLRRFPRIRWIFAHGAGVMPLLVQRLADFTAWDAVGPQKMKQLFPQGIEAEFARLHFEGAQAWTRTNLSALRSLVSDRQILFGSDYPFFSLEHSVQRFAEASLPAKSRAAIGRGNAARLLPRWG